MDNEKDLNKEVWEDIGNFNAKGFWKIITAVPEKNRHRVGRYITFPWTLHVGDFWARWVYINYVHTDAKGGCMCTTSRIENLQISENNKLKITTYNSEYVFERIS